LTARGLASRLDSSGYEEGLRMLGVGDRGRPRFVLESVMGLSLLAILGPLPLRAAQAVTPPTEKSATAPTTADVEQTALDEAFRSAQGNPQVLIKNLEDFLGRFPRSARRDAVLRTICTYAQEANAPDVLVQYGEELLATTPADPHLLDLLVDALARRKDQASRTRAIEYSTRLIAIAEGERSRAIAARADQGSADHLARRDARLFDRRAALYRESGDLDRAMADFEKSYALYPTARAAAQLGDFALAKEDSARAMDYYLTAFVFPGGDSDFESRQEIRRKLGSLYVAQHHSELGLGDLILAHYDALMPQLAGRLSAEPRPNGGRRDPFEYVLERMDGTPLPLSTYRGKVLVLDFWATWCGPCRLEGRLIEQVAAEFRADPRANFLSLNMDEDRSGVPSFLKNQGWTLPEAYAQGLDELLNVRSLPTLLIFDPQGRVVFREDGVNPGTFSNDLTAHLRETLQDTSGTRQ